MKMSFNILERQRSFCCRNSLSYAAATERARVREAQGCYGG